MSPCEGKKSIESCDCDNTKGLISTGGMEVITGPGVMTCWSNMLVKCSALGSTAMLVEVGSNSRSMGSAKLKSDAMSGFFASAWVQEERSDQSGGLFACEDEAEEEILVESVEVVWSPTRD